MNIDHVQILLDLNRKLERLTVEYTFFNKNIDLLSELEQTNLRLSKYNFNAANTFLAIASPGDSNVNIAKLDINVLEDYAKSFRKTLNLPQFILIGGAMVMFSWWKNRKTEPTTWA